MHRRGWLSRLLCLGLAPFAHKAKKEDGRFLDVEIRDSRPRGSPTGYIQVIGWGGPAPLYIGTWPYGKTSQHLHTRDEAVRRAKAKAASFHGYTIRSVPDQGL